MGCKKKELPILYVKQEILPYCWFSVGSYWIYEEENTPGWIDSSFVKSRWTNIDPDESYEGYRAEYYGSTQVIRGKVFGQGRRSWPLSSDLASSYSVMSEAYTDTASNAFDYTLFWNPMNPSDFPGAPNTLTILHLDSVSVGNRVFYDVYDVGHEPQAFVAHSRRIVWARNIGVIKRVMADGTIWNLVRHHIY